MFYEWTYLFWMQILEGELSHVLRTSEEDLEIYLSLIIQILDTPPDRVFNPQNACMTIVLIIFYMRELNGYLLLAIN